MERREARDVEWKDTHTAYSHTHTQIQLNLMSFNGRVMYFKSTEIVIIVLRRLIKMIIIYFVCLCEHLLSDITVVSRDCSSGNNNGESESTKINKCKLIEVDATMFDDEDANNFSNPHTHAHKHQIIR